MATVGTNVVRKEAPEKVTGGVRYTADRLRPGILHACLLTSKRAHARVRMDVSHAQSAPGVAAVVTAGEADVLCGVLIKDRPLLAKETVRYYGEPLAIVVAHSEREARAALDCIRVEYEDLPVVGSIADALSPGACILHENMDGYETLVEDVYPQPGTNIASSYKILKGDLQAGWKDACQCVERCFSMPQTAHAAMETHSAQCEIFADGRVHILSSTQSPYTVKKLLSGMFELEEGKISVDVSMVGGGFGGKSAVTLEPLAYVASRACGGRRVLLKATRADEMTALPCRAALEARVKLGVTKEGKICAAEMTYALDAGAYSDITPYIAKAIAADCTGPYNVENLSCECLCVYTNHTYATAYRGFGHESMTFCIERMMDALAHASGMDAMDIRQINALVPGNLSPTQVEISRSNAGDIGACVAKLREICAWDEENCVNIGDGKVRAKGVACLWKAPNPPPNAAAGAVITFNEDGSVNLNTGVVEIGSGSQSMIAQMVADKLRMPYERVHVVLETDTRTMPHYYKTVASMAVYLVGRAAMKACEDVIAQLKRTAAVALRCEEGDLDYGEERVYIRYAPKYQIGFQDLAYGLQYEDGNTVGGQIIGRGGVTFEHLTALAPENGKGKSGPAWCVGAQAVEVEYDARECSYRLLRAWTVMDVGCAVDPDAQRAMIRGGMSMGLSLASRESVHYMANCVNESKSFRTYKVLHIGEEPQYVVEFVETPQVDAPYGMRAFSEHGIIGMPGALANALSRATGYEVNALPVTQESLWHLTGGAL